MEDVLVIPLTEQASRTAALHSGAGTHGFAPLPDDVPSASIKRYLAENKDRGAWLRVMTGPAHETVVNHKEIEKPGSGELPSDPFGARTLLLGLAAASDARKIRRMLDAEGGHAGKVTSPAIRYPIARSGTGRPSQHEHWPLRLCGFYEAWEALHGSGDPDPIAVVDQGRDYGHPELAGRITTRGILSGEAASWSIHAGAVAGVISAHRDEQVPDPLAGCCTAPIHLYNVWSARGQFSSEAYYHALKTVAEECPPVLNLSMAGTGYDPYEEELLKACIARGVVVVAAAGNRKPSRGQKLYPADYDDVIAVGSVSRTGVRSAASNSGPRVHIYAAGERVPTILAGNAYEERTGTSYATAMVSAAVWLARQFRPDLKPLDLREVLTRSAAQLTGRGSERGLLNMGELARLLTEVPRHTGVPG